MTSRLADRLSAARRRRFVGREVERALFQATLTAPELPFCVLYLFGPGGVGKTTLLKEFIVLAEQAGVATTYIDARNFEPAPAALIAELQRALAVDTAIHPLDALAERPGRHLLLIDTYETLAPLDGWLRDTFLPLLPDDNLIVLAGRQPPPARWRADPGWQTIIRTVPLRNLSPVESRAYLAGRDIPPDRHDQVLAFTHGHPLALSLVTDVFAQRGHVEFHLENEPDIVKTLLEELVQKVPGPAHRTAVEAAALVRLTTENLLAEMLGVSDAHDLFEWLRGLSFVESGPLGLFPHDLARDALAADLRWRNPPWYAELHHRARRYYTATLQQTREREQQRVLFDYLFLHRDNAVVRPYMEWQESGTVMPAALEERDRPALLAMVAQHEGRESAALAEHWFARQPEGVQVYRDAEGTPIAFMALVALEQTRPEDRAADPAVAAAWRFLEGRAPLRPGERATHFRFWLARDTYQAVSAAQSLIFMNAVRHYLITSNLAYTFFPVADPAFWMPVLSYADLARLPEADYEVSGRRYGVYGHDWRVRPFMAWLEVMAEREIAATAGAPPPPAPAAPLVVLSEPAFAAAVRAALHEHMRPDGLIGNPLLQSRLVVARAGVGATTAERTAALLALLKRAAGALEASPHEAKLYRAVYHTYIQPAPTQEQAAEALDLPFSTYRRHLKTGLGRLAEILWQWEIEEAEQSAGI